MFGPGKSSLVPKRHGHEPLRLMGSRCSISEQSPSSQDFKKGLGDLQVGVWHLFVAIGSESKPKTV